MASRIQSSTLDTDGENRSANFGEYCPAVLCESADVDLAQDEKLIFDHVATHLMISEGHQIFHR